MKDELIFKNAYSDKRNVERWHTAKRAQEMQ